MGVGRYVCVALPFILTVASIICMLIAGLTGVVNNNLYLFRVDVSNMSIDAATFATFINTADSVINKRDNIDWHDSKLIEDLTSIDTDGDGTADVDAAAIAESLSQDGTPITEADLGLAKIYDVSLWGYCATQQDDSRNCTKAEYNWAQKYLSTDAIVKFNELAGINITIPSEIQSGIDAYIAINRWTEIVYVIAMIALGLELAVGLFTACSRAISCVTWLIAVIAVIAVIGAASMMTATAAVVIGTIEASAQQYNMSANFNNNFLAITWLGAALAVGASLFWLFSVCCCKPEHRPYNKKSKHADDTEKFLPTGTYQPIGDNHNNRQSGYNYGYAQRGGARSDLAYEPYSHQR